jgi:Domain of unknown function (DUF4136)
MKKFFSIFLLAAGAVITFTGCSTTSHVEVAQGVNFNNYKTFGWVNKKTTDTPSRSNNDIVDNNIKNSISADLEKKGWQETDQHPDVLLDYNVMVEKGVRRETEPAYGYPYSGYYFNPMRRRLGYYYDPGFFSGYYTYNVPFKEGVLTVNMIDAKNNKLIWQGSAKGDITSKTVTTKEAQEDVKSIFKKFNLPVTNNS